MGSSSFGWIRNLDTTITILLSTRNNMRGVSPGLRKQLGTLEEPWWLLRNSKMTSQSLEEEWKLRLQAVGAPVSSLPVFHTETQNG